MPQWTTDRNALSHLNNIERNLTADKIKTSQLIAIKFITVGYKQMTSSYYQLP